VRGEGKIVSERAIKLHRIIGGISPLILNLGNKWKRAVRATSSPLDHGERAAGYQLGAGMGGGLRGAGPNVLEEKNVLRVCL
jgi:hypothetical protein